MRDLILTGFMGTGKTTAGRRIAQTFGLRFVDLDEEIERNSGRSIPDIFQSDGEAAFRSIETSVWRGVLAEGQGRVIATGGGTLVAEENRLMVGDDRVVFTLACDLDESIARSGDRARPLMRTDDRGSMSALLESRRPVYDLYPQIRTDGGEEILTQVATFLSLSEAAALEFEHRSSSEILMARGLAGRVGSVLAEREITGDLMLVTDQMVRKLPRTDQTVAALKDIYTVHECVVPAGEEHKTLETVHALYRSCLEHRLDRDAVVIGLGGGVVGDMAGMLAATYLRGLRLVLIPTTLLAQVDAAIGGKVGVDLDGAKNMVGAFHPARAILIDPDLLETLPDAALSDGLAEVAKIGLVRCAELLEWTDGLLDARGILSEPSIIRRAALEKARVVREDPYERGVRALLNFGHTVGHAIEAASRYRLSHGSAVAVGMVAETWLAERNGWARRGPLDRLHQLLPRLGLPTRAPGVDPTSAVAFMGQDKKRRAGTLHFAVPAEAGRGIVVDVSPEDARRAIDFAVGETT